MQTPRIADIRKNRILDGTRKGHSPDLYHLAFDTSLLPNIISTVSSGRIIKANAATCKLLGYSENELLTRTSNDIFNIARCAYMKMLEKRIAQGCVKACVAMITKNGKQLPCEITSVVFTGGGEKRSITTIVDLSQRMADRKKIHRKNNGVVARSEAHQIARAVAEAHEQERADISRELHDNINQLLGVSKLYLETGRKNEADKDFYLGRSAEYMFNAIEEIRKLTRGLMTDVIRDLGLSEAVGNIMKDTMEVHPVRICCGDFSILEKPLNDKFKMNIFRIIQEQLNNILKHARASGVTIDLVQNKSDIILSVTDNGVGFDTTQKTTGIGLANIKSRATAYKGAADFVSRPGAGCSLTVTFPVSNALLNED